MRKEISILISSVFIVTLISSTAVQSVRVSGAQNQDFLYTVSVTPNFARVQQGEFGTYDVKVLRGPDGRPFSVDLSLSGDSTIPRVAATFNPPVLNIEQGQTQANSTLKINTHGLDTGSFRFRVEAAAHTPASPDQAVSNPAALIVIPSSNSITTSESLSSAPSDVSPAPTGENNRALPEATPTPTPAPTSTQPNHAPIAKAGQDQAVNEGERGTLDGSASIDPDKDSLSFSWEQLVPRQPSIKLITSEASGKASFIAPDVDRDTVFRFNLIVQDGNGGQAADLVNVLVKNVALAEAPDTAEPQGGQQEPGTKETTTGSDSTAPSGPTSGESAAASTDNHSPTAEAMQTILVNDGSPLSFSLKGNDPDNDDSISFVIVTNPLRGTLAGFDKATGSVTYVPASGFTGQDSLSFKVVDSSGADSNVGLVVLKASSKVGNTSPSSSPQAKENSTQSTNPSNNGSSAVTPAGSSLIDDAALKQSNKSSVNKPGENQSVAAANQTGIENMTLASNVSSFSALSVPVGETYKFAGEFGGFNKPHAIDVDSSGKIYVADTGNNLVKVFNPDGTPAQPVSQFGSGQLNSPQGISVCKAPSRPTCDGNIYVVDTNNNLIKKFSPSGTLLSSWGGKGTGNGQFDTPVSIDHDSMGNTYVADANNKRIVKSNDGQFITKWSSAGQGAGPMKGPHGITVDSANNVYVTDIVNNEVMKFDSNGQCIQVNGKCATIAGLNAPHGLGADSQDSIFVTVRGNNLVKKYDNSMTFLTEFPKLPDSPGAFNGPDGVTISSTGRVYVTDVDNNKVQIWKPAPTISISLKPPSTAEPKWDHEITVTATAINFDPTDKAVFVWGDNTPPSTPISIPQSGTFDVTHVYGIGSLSTNPNNMVGKIQSSTGQELATSQAIAITVQKHVTELTLEMRASAGTPETAVCANCAFYAFGKLVDKDDIDSTPDKELSGKTITFSGNGVPATLSSSKTEGVTFSAPVGQSLTVTSGVLRMPVGSHISLPASTGAIIAKFVGASGPTIGLTLTKSNNAVTTANPAVGTQLNLDTLDSFVSYKDIAITNVGGSSSNSEFVELEFIFARGSSVLQMDPSDKYQVDFTKTVAAEGQYPTLVIHPELYFSTGATQLQNSGGLKITAAFDGSNDVAYLGATSPELSYTVDDSEAGVGEGLPTGNVPADAIWTLLQVGTGASNDVCTQAGARDFDTDQDGICDKWESSSGGNGNTATQRFIVCPSKSSAPTAIDPDCSDANGNAATTKYDLCHNDMFPGIWPNPPTNGKVCPTVGHKDIYVEIDYLSTHNPSDTAIKNVIKAFGNAPFSGQQQDSFGRTDGITLHVIKDQSLTTSSFTGKAAQDVSFTPVYLWRDPPGAPVGSDGLSKLDSFLEIKNAKFGTAAEQGTANWNTFGKTLKHYVYHYGLWINYYGGVGATCPAGGLSSGLAETLGNDFVVSLGCGFASFGSTTSTAQQAGTFMHELGHNLNLGHGGPYSTLGAVPAENYRSSLDYNMNCKPNYLSVMSYARQMPNSGYDTDGVAGTTNEVTNWEAGYNYGAAGVQTALDYARAVAPTPVAPTVVGKLAESGISEATGIPASNGRTYNIVYKRGDGAVTMGTTKADINFDGDSNVPSGATGETLANYDINDLTGANVGGCGPSLPAAIINLGQPTAGNTMRSYNDWADVKLVFLDDAGGDSQDGVSGQRPYRELAPPFLDAIEEHAPDNNIQFIPPPSTDGSSVSNAGSSVPLKFRLTDSDGNFVRNAAITFLAKKGTNPTVTPFATGTFVYDLPTEKYQATLTIPKTVKGVISIYYIQNNGAANEILLQGPEAKAAGAPYTYTMTSK